MPKLGTVVRIVYPEYAEGYLGVIVAREESGRWLVRIEKNQLTEEHQPWLLSLTELDFEVIET